MKITDSDISLFKEIISIETIKDNTGGINKCLDILSERFSGSFAHTKKFSYKDRNMLVFSNTDNKKVDFIFAGHIDVVGGDRKSFVLRETEDNFIGRGVLDMKGPLFFSLLAVEEFLKKSNDLKIAIFVTSDEETDGLSTKYLIEEQGYSADFAIIPDGGYDENIVVKQKGFLQVRCNVFGSSSHAGRPWEGKNAIDISIGIYQNLLEKFPLPKKGDEWKTSISLTKIVSGDDINDDINKIPEKSEFYFDIRYIDNNDKKKILESIDKGLAGEGSYSVVAENGLLDTDTENKYLLRFKSSFETVLGREVNFIKTNTTSDAIFLSENGIPTVLFYPKGGGNHEKEEWVDKKSLYNFYIAVIEFLNKSV